MRRILLSLWLFCAVVAAFAQGGGVPIDGIVAVIGKSVILRSDLEKHFNDYTAQFKTVENPDEIYCSILENLVYTKLMVNQAEIDSIEITDEEIDYRINMRMSYFLQQTGGDVKYIENYFNKPMSEIKKDMRELMYEQALTEQVQSSITSDITVTPSEVQQFASKISPDSMPMVST